MPAPEPFGLTQTGATIAATGTFQVALAANAARKGGIIQNTATTALEVFLGSGTAAAASSLVLAQNGTVDLTLNVPNGIYQGEVQVAGTAGAAFVVLEATRSP